MPAQGNALANLPASRPERACPQGRDSLKQPIGDDLMPSAVRVQRPGRGLAAEVTSEREHGALKLLGLFGAVSLKSSAPPSRPRTKHRAGTDFDHPLDEGDERPLFAGRGKLLQFRSVAKPAA